MHSEHALLAISALLLNAALGGPARWYEALGFSSLLRFPAQAVRDIERRLNRDHRSDGERELRGLLLVAAVIIASLVAGWIGGLLFRVDLGFVELLILAIAIPVRPSWDIASTIRRSLQINDLPTARQALSHTVWRHHALLDEHGVARAGIELLAVNYSEKILAPLLWYMAFGLPGFFISKAVYLLHEVLNPIGAAGQSFGKAAACAHILLHYLPSRLAAFLWLCASPFLGRSKASAAAQQVMAQLLSALPHALSLLAAAAVLKLSLGGPTSAYVSAWIGSGTPRPVAADVRRALFLFVVLCLFMLLGLGIFL